jgi:hypothetical protein
VNATIRPFESFRVGERVEYVRTVTEADVVEFARTVVTETEIIEVVADKQLIRVRCTARGRDGAVVMEGDSLVKRLKELSA